MITAVQEVSVEADTEEEIDNVNTVGFNNLVMPIHGTCEPGETDKVETIPEHEVEVNVEQNISNPQRCIACPSRNDVKSCPPLSVFLRP